MEENYGDIKFAVDALQRGKHPEHGMMTFRNFEHLSAKDWELAL